MKNKKRFKYLLDKYLNNQISFNEKTEFFQLVASGHFDDVIEDDIDKSLSTAAIEATQYPLISGSMDDALSTVTHPENEAVQFLKPKKIIAPVWRYAAAAIFIIVAMATFYFKNQAARPGEVFLSAFKKNNDQQITNSSNAPLPVILPDGSRILLQPAASLLYSKEHFGHKREVYMEGEAKFDITKDPLNPFYVFYGDVVTKVLGTSFNIRTNKTSGNIEVEVLTGKVQVYENVQIHNGEKKVDGVIVTPNQKAVYQSAKRVFAATLVEAPKIISTANNEAVANKDNDMGVFIFEAAKLSSVLKTIEVNYGIQIDISNEQIAGCEFTGDLSSQDLYNKLKVICLATNLSYEVAGTKILLKGEGCK